MADRPLISAVFERKPAASSGVGPTFASSSKSGFPAVQHRSKSVFARGRDLNIHTSKDEPILHDWHRQISEENDRIVESMTEEEREHERQEIFERFGPGVGETLKRATEVKKTVANTMQIMDAAVDPEEGTPEDIRRRFFPNLRGHDPTVDWMKSSLSPDATPSALRFDLTGAVIPSSLVSTLPTHLGLHHHAEGAHAGYTLDDIFLLSRSTVPAQRATMLGVLSRIARRLGRKQDSGKTHIDELAGRADELRTRILAAGVGAMDERGSVGVRAVEVLWECIVQWDGDILGIEGVELKDGQEMDGSVIGGSTISSIPLQFFLPQIAVSLVQATLPPESKLQLLSILRRLAQHSNDIASAITTTPNLVSNIIQTFVVTPIPPTHVLPDPSALQLLITLALSSRANAVALIEPADALLRFVTMLPPDSPYPTPLTIALLTCTLRLYTSFASYGLNAYIATTAAVPFVKLRKYMSSSPATGYSNVLMVAWAGLAEAWTVCATDPHRTTPSHEILWSQVVGWGWSEDMFTWREPLTTACRDWEVWTAMWQTQAAFLEGARVNGVKGGAKERNVAVEALKLGFQDGKEWDIAVGAINAIQRELNGWPLDDCLGSHRCLSDTAAHARTVAAAIRLWLACVPPLSDGPLISPPFSLPFAEISDICAKLVNHSLWSVIYPAKAKPHTHAFCRSLTILLSAYLDLSRRLPGVSDGLWMAQAFSVLGRLIPGDEESALHILDQMTGMIDADWMASRGWPVSPLIWEKDGMAVITPFLQHVVRTEEVFMGPMWPSPRSILLSTTQRLPSGTYRSSGLHRDSGLPLARDWTLSPLDHLLHSGSSSVFKSLPPSWDASETQVTRASLLFAKIAQEILRPYPLGEFMLTCEEVVFGCIKVFMLEHGQPQNNAAEEVFRDSVVGRLMENLLEPFTVAAPAPSSSRSLMPTPDTRNDLEKVALRFLGPSTPFYQYYTDFVALYDAVSFSDPLFARLLLPPTSMRYPPDYRKHLWNDFGHLLKSIRTPLDQIVTNDIGEYLWPIEDDAEMIGMYLRSLENNLLTGFVRFLAIHHVACNIWPDLRQGDAIADERGRKLLMAVVEMRNVDAVREVVTYRQERDGLTILPPKCFENDWGWKELRLGHVANWGLTLIERLEVLFQAK